MKIHSIAASSILIPKNRQRKDIKAEHTMELASSIARLGLIHPVVIRRDPDDNFVLVAGECRTKAMDYIWNMFDSKVKCAGFEFDAGQVPCIFVGDLDPVDAMDMELEENIRRLDLTWQERAEATQKLMAVREAQALRDGKPVPTHVDIAEEVAGKESALSPASAIRKQLIVARHMDRPEVAKAKTLDEAFKYLKRDEAAQKNAALAASVGASLTALSHDLRQGECMEVMADLPDSTFDVICTDPPYGIDADSFGDSGGMAPQGHYYDDSWTNWHKLMQAVAPEFFRLCKPTAHLYLFCDIDNFVTAKNIFMQANWRVFRTPLIWVNPLAIRAPWPQHGPQRKYQVCLYAVKGDRNVLHLKPDVLTYPGDDNLGWAAQKPVALYRDLLQRSTGAGGVVLDPFGGSGPIIPAAHELACRATYIERDPVAFGIAVKRTQALVK